MEKKSKPGWRTSEAWLIFAGMLFEAINASGILANSDAAHWAAAAAMVYGVLRTFKKDQENKVAGKLELEAKKSAANLLSAP